MPRNRGEKETLLSNQGRCMLLIEWSDFHFADLESEMKICFKDVAAFFFFDADPVGESITLSHSRFVELRHSCERESEKI